MISDNTVKAKFVSYGDAAIYLGVSERLIRKLAASKQLPCVKIGRCARIRLDDLEQYANSLPSR